MLGSRNQLEVCTTRLSIWTGTKARFRGDWQQRIQPRPVFVRKKRNSQALVNTMGFRMKHEFGAPLVSGETTYNEVTSLLLSHPTYSHPTPNTEFSVFCRDMHQCKVSLAEIHANLLRFNCYFTLFLYFSSENLAVLVLSPLSKKSEQKESLETNINHKQTYGRKGKLYASR